MGSLGTGTGGAGPTGAGKQDRACWCGTGAVPGPRSYLDTVHCRAGPRGLILIGTVNVNLQQPRHNNGKGRGFSGRRRRQGEGGYVLQYGVQVIAYSVKEPERSSPVPLCACSVLGISVAFSQTRVCGHTGTTQSQSPKPKAPSPLSAPQTTNNPQPQPSFQVRLASSGHLAQNTAHKEREEEKEEQRRRSPGLTPSWVGPCTVARPVGAGPCGPTYTQCYRYCRQHTS